MAAKYSIEICRILEKKFHDAGLYRPMRIVRYDDGTRLVYDVTSVSDTQKCSNSRIHLVVDRFVGGGFAGQVYRVKVVKIENGSVPGLVEDGIYAMKIMIPPSGAALLFRNLIYVVGFQGPFQLQANPEAAMSGAIWQKFIRRGAKIRFGDESMVNDIHALFVDTRLGSCGELTDWVEGRTWRLEVDDHMDMLNACSKGEDAACADMAGSPEYRAKKKFMCEFVSLLHDMGGHEFARQYEWSTCKSQPNCLKRTDVEGDPCAGLIAVDFRAGLALLPFLPMSPGDFLLIAKGLKRGSLVQFDRGDVGRLEEFVDAHSKDFEDMRGMLGKLKAAEQVYRSSLPDVTHNHVRLLKDRSLWSSILGSAVTGWRVRNFIDAEFEKKLKCRKVIALLFYVVSLLPFLGRFILKVCGHADWRKHYLSMLTDFKYLARAVSGKTAEKAIIWHRAERVGSAEAIRITGSFRQFILHQVLSVLPVGMHRLMSSLEYAKQCIYNIMVRPVRLYFNADMREQWLREMVDDGRKKHIISEEDAGVILSKIKEPFIQKYLKSLAVHVCTLPVTQLVSVAVAITYVLMHPEMPRTQSWGIGLGIIALFQVMPISPGSVCRGLYVLYLVIRERNFKDYNIAVFLGFFKYVGYLAFPIQMAYRYPTLARFMAAHWATEAVHIVPVFGETGALLEHAVFCLFYNWPLTIRRRMRLRAERRAEINPRYWHVGLYVVLGAAMLGVSDFVYLNYAGALPGLKDIAWLVIMISVICGAGVTAGCGGSSLGKRFILAAVCGLMTGLFYSAVSAAAYSGVQSGVGEIVISCVWRVFVFSILTTVAAIITELKMS